MAISAIVRLSPRTIQCHHSGENIAHFSFCPYAPDGGGTSPQYLQPPISRAGIQVD
ncbi:MAG TPA: hypothetical protein PK752_17750 [Accumulibacter sp.]|uniref:hypothetical protein n=1 Tax=Accumulibacter sp. TaxID=2053492 RepID=UPI002BC88FB5|nr:hypothetical protein [Accumulibacter sp.]HRD90082.1 hypothetical protein [Accumulibacter sp.]